MTGPGVRNNGDQQPAGDPEIDRSIGVLWLCSLGGKTNAWNPLLPTVTFGSLPSSHLTQEEWVTQLQRVSTLDTKSRSRKFLMCGIQEQATVPHPQSPRDVGLRTGAVCDGTMNLELTGTRVQQEERLPDQWNGNKISEVK